MTEKSDKPYYFSAIIAGFSFGTIPIFSAILRDLSISSIEQTFLRILFGSFFGLGILFLYFLKRKRFVRTSWKLDIQKTYLIQGILFVLMILVYLSSIALNTPVGEAALLVQTHPIITLIVGYYVLDEEITLKKVSAIILSMGGLVLLTEPWKWETFLATLIGDLFALANGFLYAIYLLVGRASSKTRENIPYVISISWVLFWSIIIAIPLLTLLSFLPLPTSLISFSLNKLITPQILILGISFAFFGSIIPYGLIMIAQKRIESSKTSILLLGEPVGAIILGALILNEGVSVFYLIGGFLIIIAVIMTSLTIKEKVDT
ncbi:MAG: conserved membrane protein of unknown function [Promethearchaeota archaeon]|nr:MAG: conserved membrane protein of unknown function [Candidatus Lokiarchaeota archaeon]